MSKSHNNSQFDWNQLIGLFHHFMLKRKSISSLEYRYFIILAGIPPTIAYGGTFLFTTARAKTTAPSPIITPPNNKAPSPIQQSEPILTSIFLCWSIAEDSDSFCLEAKVEPF